MAFSQTDIDEMKARARDAGFGAKPLEIEAATQDAAAFVADDVERIELDGRVAVATGPLTDAERRAITVQLAGEEFDERRHNEISGTLSGRIEVTGAGAKAKERASAAIRRKSADAARMQSLLALQAQLEALELRIAQLDLEIDDILAKHLTPEELARLDGFKDPEEKAREEMRLMREKLERGEMTQAEFDAFEMRWQERAEKRAQKAKIDRAMEHGSPEEQQRLAETEDLEAVREARDKAAPEMKEKIEATLVIRDHEGNDTLKNDRSDTFGIGGMSDDDLFRAPIEPAKSISTAQAIAPDNPVRDAAPDLKGDYRIAAADTGQIESDVQAALQIQNIKAPSMESG